MAVAIKVENLSKKYIIRHEKKSGSYETFSDTIVQGSKNIAKKIIHPFSGKELDSQTHEEFWALKDVNFEINQGDKVGIIGRNGAGKSTLLKVLSRITEPTSGKIHINGRIASLLEVGTGFHPELTGRENIYLNGTILGMSRKEIKAKFDEIVAFAEVDKFLDTPVKRYSSGMYVRLAFAVAAHLEPEILVIDEVLAVGDIEFQKKCLGKMEEVSKEGRTVLFVSHNMTMIQRLCNKGILLVDGAINGVINEMDIILNRYNMAIELQNNTQSKLIELKDQRINTVLIELLDTNRNKLPPVIDKKEEAFVRLTIDVKSDILKNFTIGYSLFDGENNWLYRTLNTDINENNATLKFGKIVFESKISMDILNEGQYSVVLDGGIYREDWIFNPQVDLDNRVSFSVQGGLSESSFWREKRKGIIAPELGWNVVVSSGE